MIGTAAPAGSGLPLGRATTFIAGDAATLPVTGIPVLVMHGPIAIRAALGISGDKLLVRPLPPLVPSARLRRDEVISIEVEEGHWYALGRRVVCIKRTKGPSIRLMAPAVQGVPDSTTNLNFLLRAWWLRGH